MPKDEHSNLFNAERAVSHDERFAKLAPMRDGLHFLMRIVLSELPSAARILCVGAGTGPELIDLAEAYPAWQFTAVDPSAPMLAVCRKQAEAHGFASRCSFHEGYVDSLPESEPFDAATCLLVSHFLTDPEQRRELYRQIAARVRPGGYLVNADLASDMSSPEFKSLIQVWVRMLKYSGMPDEEVEKFRSSCGKNVALLPPEEVASIISASGFDEPVLFAQTLLIHAWYSRRAS